MLTSVFNIQLSVSHIAGKNNAIADLLSRWWVTDNRDQKLPNLLHHWNWIPTHIDLVKLIMVFSTFLFAVDYPFAAQLATKASNRLWDAFRPATQKAYARMFRDFMGFLVAAGPLINQVTTVTLLIFVEFLLDQKLSPVNIVNHMVAIRSQFILYGLDTAPFRDKIIDLFQKSLMHTRPLCPRTVDIITTKVVADILLVSSPLEYPLIF